MRTPRRSTRALRPEILSLETVCPVSSLATGLPALVASAASSGTRMERSTVHQPSAVRPVAVRTSTTAPARGESPQAPPTGPAASSTTWVSANLAPAPSTETTLANAIPAPSVITVSAAPPPARSTSAGASQPALHGGAPGPASTQPASAAGASQPAPHDGSVSPDSTQLLPTSAGAIRPMTMTPQQGLVASANTPIHPDSGGGPPVSSPISIVASGGGLGSVKQSPGVYTENRDVYIGTIITVSLTDLPPAGSTINWSNGTNYASYGVDVTKTSDNYINASVVTGVVKTNPSYVFIADATPRSYQITVHVVYPGTPQTTGDATFTFNTISPAASISGADGKASAPNLGNGTISLSYYPPIYFTAKTPAAQLDQNKSPVYGTGTYTFLQVVEPERLRKTFPGAQTLTWKDPANDGIAWYLDDGGPKTVAYGVSSLSSQPPPFMLRYGGLTWDDSAPNTLYARTNDAPGGTYSAAANTEVDVNNEQYKMYLMFKPPGGVWIGLAYVKWGWSASATGGPTFWTGTASIVPSSVTAPLSGGEEFPNWSGRTSQGSWM